MAGNKSNQVGGKRQLIEKANSHIFTTVIIASIVVSASIVAINFMWNLRSFQGRVIEKQETARDTVNQNIENARELEQSFIALEESDVDSQLVLDALPSKYDFPAVASSVEKLTDLGGVKLDEFTGEDVSDGASSSEINPTPVEMPFQLTITGNEKEIQKFIGVLERSIRPFRIDAMTLSAADKDLNVALEITTFYQPSESLEVESETVK